MDFIYLECGFGLIFGLLYTLIAIRGKKFDFRRFIDYLFYGLAIAAFLGTLAFFGNELGYEIPLNVVVKDFMAPMMGIAVGGILYFTLLSLEELVKVGLLPPTFNFKSIIEGTNEIKKDVINNKDFFILTYGALIPYALLLWNYDVLFGYDASYVLSFLYHTLLLFIIIMYREELFNYREKIDHGMGIFMTLPIIIGFLIPIIVKSVIYSTPFMLKINPFLLLYVGIYIPLTEEILFRGYLQPHIGYHETSILFAFTHIPIIFYSNVYTSPLANNFLNFIFTPDILHILFIRSPIVYRMCIFIAILALSYYIGSIRHYSKSILYPIIGHSLYNLLVVSIFY